MLKENNLILHVHLQGSMCQAAVCTGMEDAAGEVGEGACFSLALQPGCICLARLSLETDKVCAGDRQQDGSDLQTH